MTNTEANRVFLPAMGRDWLLPIYDPLTRLLGLNRIRRTLLEQAGLDTAARVLDVGCGTGTLAVQIKQRHSTVDVVALDPDPRAIAKGQRKSRRAGASIQFDRGFADALPYPDASFDRVFSSFMFHHLERQHKTRALQEIRRVLKPGGRLQLVDFDGSTRGIHSHHRLADNAEDRVLTLLKQAGFEHAAMIRTEALLAGHLRIVYYQAGV